MLELVLNVYIIGVGRCFCVGGLLCAALRAARVKVVWVHAHPGEFASSEMNSGVIWGNIIYSPFEKLKLSKIFHSSRVNSNKLFGNTS